MDAADIEYFKALCGRFESATLVSPIDDISIFAWLRPHDCHANARQWVDRFPGYELVGGWLITGNIIFLIQSHSVVRRQRDQKLFDVTLMRPELPFLDHQGSGDFEVLAKRYPYLSFWSG